ncbi:hypothetical protein PNOK_0838700 [Pyrrhoderma noxium]|uniref:Uncharacterized protein n=1 Tax=Pyrrhoderma noxium TaxID=2282107 RepID=A0A286UB35_9AGAM|nr:hypothetical protein PNOK_0838700 [Pyrrhoderma noxium]
MNMRSLLNEDNQTPQVPHRKLDKPNPATSGTNNSTTFNTSTHKVQPNEQNNRIPILPSQNHAKEDAVPNQTSTIHQIQKVDSQKRTNLKGNTGDSFNSNYTPGGQLLSFGTHVHTAPQTFIGSPRPHVGVGEVSNQTATIREFQAIGSDAKISRKGAGSRRNARDNFNSKSTPGGRLLPVGTHTSTTPRTSLESPRPHAEVDKVDQAFTIHKFQLGVPQIDGDLERGFRNNLNLVPPGGGRISSLRPNTFSVKTFDSYSNPPQTKPRLSKVTTSNASGSSRPHAELAGSTAKTAKNKNTGDHKVMTSIFNRYCGNRETEGTELYYRMKVARGLESALAGSGIDTFEKIHADICASELHDFMNVEKDLSRNTIAKIKGVFESSKTKIELREDKKERTRYRNLIDKALRSLEKTSQKSDRK